MKRAIVFGAAGFIGNHLVSRLKSYGFWVRGVDLVPCKHHPSRADEFILGDLRNLTFLQSCLDKGFDELYQLAADMGGAGYVFTGNNDANILHNSALINLNTLSSCVEFKVNKVFFASSACIYPKHNQENASKPICYESSAYPANPDSEYGWEKLFSERLYSAYRKNYGLQTKIARFHNVYGTLSIWDGGKEKAPAAICRKVALAKNGSSVDVWGDGKQTRSFLFIDDCLDAIRLLMDQEDFHGPVNIGSTETISIADLTRLIIEISKKELKINFVDGPVGVNGRTSDNTLVEKHLNWKMKTSLNVGLNSLFSWINSQISTK